jgi:hypothetical protein
MVRWLLDLVGVYLATYFIQWVVRKLPRSLVDNAVTSYLDNKIGWLFGLTESQVDGFLSEWIVPIALAVLAVVIWHRLASRQLRSDGQARPKSPVLVWVETLPSKFRIWIARVEPFHVIILGLAIAIGGVVWQWRRIPSPDPKIAQLELKLEAALKGSEAKVSPPTAAPSPQQDAAKETPVYLVRPKNIPVFAGDIADKIAAIDSVLAIEEDIEALLVRGGKLKYEWSARVLNDKKNYDTELIDYGKAINETFGRIYKVVNDKRFVKFKDVAELSRDTRAAKFGKAFADFRVAINSLGDPPTGNYQHFVSEPYNALNSIFVEVADSVGLRRKMLLEWRDQIIQEAPPGSQAKSPVQSASPQDSFVATYTMSQADIRNLRDEIFKIKSSLPEHITIQTADDVGARHVANALSKGIGFGGINVDGMSVGYPITPKETGISIRIADLNKKPNSAIKLAEAITKITGVEPQYTAAPNIGPDAFVLFAGTNPKEQ